MVRPVICDSEKNFIVQGCLQDCRKDGRSRLDTRPYSTSTFTGEISQGCHSSQPLVLSNGSARVCLPTGETDILVSVRAELVVPSPSCPESGSISVHVDVMQSRNEELETTLSELLLPHLVSPEDLCVVEGHFVWKLFIDIVVLSSGGGCLVDACGRGIHAALEATRLPKVQQIPSSTEAGKVSIEIEGDLSSARKIVTTSGSYLSTVCALKLNGDNKPVFIVDANEEEEACAFAQVHAVLDQPHGVKKASIAALQKAGGGSLPFNLLQELTSFISSN